MANLFSEACAKIVQFCARELSRLSETQQNFCIMIIL